MRAEELMSKSYGGLFAASTVIAMHTAWAQGYPERPVRVLVGLAPGAVSYTHLTLPTKA